MKRTFAISYLIIAALLALVLVGLSAGSSEAAPLGFTDTPTAEPTDTPEPPTDTPEPRDTLTPTNTARPRPKNTPVPATPVETPVGTITLPVAGTAMATPLWLLLSAAGGLLALGAYLLRRSTPSL